MPDWRRAHLPGGTYFFTLVTADRAPILTMPLALSLLRDATLECRRRWPFHMEAVVLMPDHLHTIWRLPEGDSEYAKRLGWLKKEFARRWIAAGGEERPTSEAGRRNRRRGVWQRRFWEHVIRNELDLRLRRVSRQPVGNPYRRFGLPGAVGRLPPRQPSTNRLTRWSLATSATALRVGSQELCRSARGPAHTSNA